MIHFEFLMLENYSSTYIPKIKISIQHFEINKKSIKKSLNLLHIKYLGLIFSKPDLVCMSLRSRNPFG